MKLHWVCAWKIYLIYSSVSFESFETMLAIFSSVGLREAVACCSACCRIVFSIIRCILVADRDKVTRIVWFELVFPLVGDERLCGYVRLCCQIISLWDMYMCLYNIPFNCAVYRLRRAHRRETHCRTNDDGLWTHLLLLLLVRRARLVSRCNFFPLVLAHASRPMGERENYGPIKIQEIILSRI